eukprot:COSAG05_NODE_1352_length_5112_cov_27.256533_3_plen_441_part_00
MTGSGLVHGSQAAAGHPGHTPAAAAAAAAVDKLHGLCGDASKLGAAVAVHADRLRLGRQLVAALPEIADAGVAERGIQAVAALAASDIRIQEILVDSGAVPCVLRAMKTHIETNVAIQLRGCHALACLAPQLHRDGAENPGREAASAWAQWAADCAEDAVGAVISSMEMFVGEPAVQAEGCHALAALLHMRPAPSLAMKNAVARLATVPTQMALEVLSHHRDNAPLCEAALWVLERYVSHDVLAQHAGLAAQEYAGVRYVASGRGQRLPGRVQEAIEPHVSGALDEHILRAAADSLACHMEEVGVCWAASEVLRSIFARGERSKAQAMVENAVEGLVQAVGNHHSTALRPRPEPGPPSIEDCAGRGGMLPRRRRPQPCVAVAACGALRALLHCTRDGGIMAVAVARSGGALALVQVANSASILEADLASLALSTLSELGA